MAVIGQDRVHPYGDDGFRTSLGAVFRDMYHMSERLPAISLVVRFSEGDRGRTRRPVGRFVAEGRRQLAARDEDPSITRR